MSNELMNIGTAYSTTGEYMSIIPDSEQAQKIIFNSINNPTFKSDDMINKEFALRDIIIQKIEVTDNTTGETDEAPRIILINDKGESAAFVSKGMFTAVKNLCMVFGPPTTWTEPKDIIIKQKAVKAGTMLTIELV